jgi:tyrosyl-tRNA synthetase
MDAKKQLARLVVTRFHGEAAARVADDAFPRQYQEREVPEDVREIPYPVPSSVVQVRVFEVVLATHLASSASEARRLTQQGGIRIDGERVEDPYQTMEIRVGETHLVQRGRRDFARLRGVRAAGAEGSGKTP